MAKKAPKKMEKRDFPSNKKRAQLTKEAQRINLALRLQAVGFNKFRNNTEIGRDAADMGTAGLVPNKAGKKMQAGKSLKTPMMGRDIPLPKTASVGTKTKTRSRVRKDGTTVTKAKTKGGGDKSKTTTRSRKVGGTKGLRKSK
ncbi:hypothetical protein N9242_03985 [Vicingaceae bacterium]|nr:hypothetical protein [Vicingaceae bacterium]